MKYLVYVIITITTCSIISSCTTYTPITTAVSKGELNLVKDIIEKDGDKALYDNIDNALIIAVKKRQIDIIKYLISVYKQKKLINPIFEILYDSDNYENLSLLNYLMKNGIDINESDGNGHTVMDYCYFYGGEKEWKTRIIIKNLKKFGVKDHIPKSGNVIIFYSIWTTRDYEKYIGQIKNDKRHGIGTIISSHGSIFKGTWVDDYRNGKGTCKCSETETTFSPCSEYFQKGAEFTGIWKNDFLNGPGTYFHKWYGKFIGSFKDNQFGEGKWYYSKDRAKQLQETELENQGNREACSQMAYYLSSNSNSCRWVCSKYFPNDRSCLNTCCDCWKLLSKEGDAPCH